ncbi:DUF4389 domain-containing protein [Streptomyces sp. NPDC088197]|uniref:DUF4389 domain-containing protein n=1 Tax=Streptomyces sp. NPDC088197 TaxID=3365840 RepID=UPI003822974C
MTQPMWARPEGAEPVEWLPELDMPDPGRQRRLTVLLRWLLLIPQFIVVFVLGVGAFFTVIVGWFAALFTGHLPEGVARYLGAFLAYETRVHASAMLLVDRYPPFALRPAEHYPVRIELRPGPLNRLAVFFRIILMIPAGIVQGLVTSGWYALAFIIWLITLVLGRMPRPLFEASAATLRYSMRFSAYVLLLTSAYPKRLFGDGDAPGAVPGAVRPGMPGAVPGDTYGAVPGAVPGALASATRPLLMSTAAKVLVGVFLAVGLAGHIVGDTVTDWNGNNDDNAAATAPAAAAVVVTPTGR